MDFALIPIFALRSRAAPFAYGMTLALALLLPVLIASQAHAQVRPLVSPGGGTTIIVWKNEKARSEGATLIAAGVNKSNPALLVPLVACVVPVGTQAIKTDGGFLSSDILITSGKAAGCRGNVTNEYLGKAATPEPPKQKSYPPPDCRKPTDQWTGERCIRGK